MIHAQAYHFFSTLASGFKTIILGGTKRIALAIFHLMQWVFYMILTAFHVKLIAYFAAIMVGIFCCYLLYKLYGWVREFTHHCFGYLIKAMRYCLRNLRAAISILWEQVSKIPNMMWLGGRCVVACLAILLGCMSPAEAEPVATAEVPVAYAQPQINSSNLHLGHQKNSIDYGQSMLQPSAASAVQANPFTESLHTDQSIPLPSAPLPPQQYSHQPSQQSVISAQPNPGPMPTGGRNATLLRPEVIPVSDHNDDINQEGLDDEDSCGGNTVRSQFNANHGQASRKRSQRRKCQNQQFRGGSQIAGGAVYNNCTFYGGLPQDQDAQRAAREIQHSLRNSQHHQLCQKYVQIKAKFDNIKTSQIADKEWLAVARTKEFIDRPQRAQLIHATKKHIEKKNKELLQLKAEANSIKQELIWLSAS